MILFYSCNNDKVIADNSDEFNVIANKGAISKQLTEFIQYSINGANLFYDDSLGYVDLEKLDDYLFEFNFSDGVSTRTALDYDDVHVDYENALSDILSNDASTYLLSFISLQENLNKSSFERIKDNFSNFSKEDQEVLNFFYTSTCNVYNEILSANYADTRAVKNALACEIAVGICGSAASWIWGSFAGGPWSVALFVAINIDATIAAHYTCVEEEEINYSDNEETIYEQDELEVEVEA